MQHRTQVLYKIQFIRRNKNSALANDPRMIRDTLKHFAMTSDKLASYIPEAQSTFSNY